MYIIYTSLLHNTIKIINKNAINVGWKKYGLQ